MTCLGHVAKPGPESQLTGLRGDAHSLDHFFLPLPQAAQPLQTNLMYTE